MPIRYRVQLTWLLDARAASLDNYDLSARGDQMAVGQVALVPLARASESRLGFSPCSRDGGRMRQCALPPQV